MGNNINSAIQRTFDLSGGGQIAITLEWDLEADFDFLVVQVYDSDSNEYVSLESEYTTTDMFGSFSEYMPGLTGTSDGTVASTFDASVYASRGEVPVVLRHLTDESVFRPGPQIYGISIDGVERKDGADLRAWSVVEDPVYDWSVTLVSYSEGNSSCPVHINDLALTDEFVVSLNKDQIEQLVGSECEFVGAKVSVIDPTGNIEVYAYYELVVNGVLQAGGS